MLLNVKSSTIFFTNRSFYLTRAGVAAAALFFVPEHPKRVSIFGDDLPNNDSFHDLEGRLPSCSLKNWTIS
jgi:hypothetical protein